MKIIYYDICSICLFAMVLLSMFLRKMTRGRSNRWFLALSFIGLVTSVVDTWSLILDVVEGQSVIKYIVNSLYLLGRVAHSLSVAAYIISITGIYNRLLRRKGLLAGIAVPLGVSVLMLAINPLNHWMFYINEQGMYTRGSLFPIIYACSFVYLIAGIVAIFKYREIIGNKKFGFLFVCFTVVIGSCAVQFLMSHLVIDMFAAAITSLLIAFEVQAPEERMSSETGLYGINAFVSDIKTAKLLKLNLSAIIICGTNYDSISDIVGYDTLHQIIRKISSEIVRLCNSYIIDADLYYLDMGRFAIVIDDRYPDMAMQVAQNVNAILSQDILIDEVSVSYLANVCVVNMPEDIDDVDFVLSFVESMVKETYTGDVRYARKLFDKRDYEVRRDMETIVERAIGSDTLNLYYQPVYSMEKGRYTSIEAFLRLHDTKYGDIAPDVIISEAEKNGLIHGITTYVLEKVCEFVSSPVFLELGIDYVEINMSPIQCMWDDFVTVALSTMESYGVQPKRICFDITDVENVSVYSSMLDNLKRLVDAGVRLVMDDFGAGVFEIDRITALPISGIKLDRNFISMGILKSNYAILKSTVGMIRDLGMQATAVGVETPEIEEILHHMGCEYMQGYLFTKPLSCKEILLFLLNAQVEG